MEIEELIKKQIADNAVLLFMKGTPQFPQCGFSAHCRGLGASWRTIRLRQYFG